MLVGKWFLVGDGEGWRDGAFGAGWRNKVFFFAGVELSWCCIEPVKVSTAIEIRELVVQPARGIVTLSMAKGFAGRSNSLD